MSADEKSIKRFFDGFRCSTAWVFEVNPRFGGRFFSAAPEVFEIVFTEADKRISALREESSPFCGKALKRCTAVKCAAENGKEDVT